MSDRQASSSAELQHGVISRTQALESGLSASQINSRIQSGRWVLVNEGTYRIVGAPLTWHRELAAARWAAGDLAAVSHRAAAELHGLHRFGQVVEVTTPRPRRCRSVDEAIIHRHRDLVLDDTVEMSGLRVTSVARTLLDLGAVVHSAKVEYCLDAALRDGKTTLGEVGRLLAARRKRGRRGAGVLAGVLEGKSEASVPESRYERDFLRLVEEMNLPEPVLQLEVRDDFGLFVARADFAWPDHRLIVEIDGHGFHATRAQRDHDSVRQNRLTNLGWSVLRFTTDQVFRNDLSLRSAVRTALS